MKSNCTLVHRSPFPHPVRLLPWLLLGISPPLHGAIQFERHAHPLPSNIWSVEAMDVNGDAKPDLVAVGQAQVWAMLAPDWKRISLAETPGGRSIHSAAYDADLDGDLDLALGRSASEWIAYRQARAEGKASAAPAGQDWTVAWLENPDGPSDGWTLHILDRELHGVHGLTTSDLDRDGDTDLVADSFAGPLYESSLAWFPAVPGSDTERPRRWITQGQATGRPHYMDVADMNGDGRGDVLLGASTEGSLTWWEQPEDLDQPWTRRLIALLPGATHPRPHDLNGDDVLDVIASAGHGVGVYWFQAPDWQRHLIDDSIRDVHAFDTADLDGDGDIDAAGCSVSQREVRWWENLGQGRFRTHVVDDANQQAAYDLKIADLDLDGRPDLLVAGRHSDNAVWYRNRADR